MYRTCGTSGVHGPALHTSWADQYFPLPDAQRLARNPWSLWPSRSPSQSRPPRSLLRYCQNLPPQPQSPLDVPSTPVNLLVRAREQADCGKLGEALATCRTYLSRTSPSAEAFSLLGVIHQARREKDKAVRCYQQALYLEPGHRDALTHLMLLCREQGDHAQAERLRRRLDRPALGGEA